MIAGESTSQQHLVVRVETSRLVPYVYHSTTKYSFLTDLPTSDLLIHTKQNNWNPKYTTVRMWSTSCILKVTSAHTSYFFWDPSFLNRDNPLLMHPRARFVDRYLLSRDVVIQPFSRSAVHAKKWVSQEVGLVVGAPDGESIHLWLEVCARSQLESVVSAFDWWMDGSLGLVSTYWRWFCVTFMH